MHIPSLITWVSSASIFAQRQVVRFFRALTGRRFPLRRGRSNLSTQRECRYLISLLPASWAWNTQTRRVRTLPLSRMWRHLCPLIQPELHLPTDDSREGRVSLVNFIIGRMLMGRMRLLPVDDGPTRARSTLANCPWSLYVAGYRWWIAHDQTAGV